MQCLAVRTNLESEEKIKKGKLIIKIQYFFGVGSKNILIFTSTIVTTSTNKKIIKK